MTDTTIEPAVYARQPGDRCPPDWVDQDNLVRVTVNPRPWHRKPTNIVASVRGQDITEVCEQYLWDELRARRIIR